VTLRRDEVVPALIAELGEFEALVRSLDEIEWKAPSRCDDWTAGDVAGHVIGQLADITAGRFDGLGTPEVTARQVEERRGRTPAELADELAQVSIVADALLGSFDEAAWNGPGPAGRSTLGDRVEALSCDTTVHADDIRAAAGRTTDMTGTRIAVSHLAQVLTEHGHAPATLKLDGLEPFAVAGGGPAITGTPEQFVLVATGRMAPESLGLDATINVFR
jgi:uncharacterized protein (TIGR03083 family)